MDSFIVKQLHTHLRIPAAFCILMSCEAELHCKIEHISPRFCKSSIPRCIHGDTPLLPAGKEVQGNHDGMSGELRMPRHVAIILDGNGRWARAKGMPRNYGHVQGAKTVETICEEAYRMGIQYLTVYAFSTENWNRPQDEVDALMKLLRSYMKTCLKTAEKNRMCVKVLGEKSRLDEDIRSRILELEEATKNNDGLHFQIAINYGGRDELVRAAKKMAQAAAEGRLRPEDISEQVMAGFLDTAGLPEPDLLIRTCNEQRISNFLLWQLAYTELYFTPVAWPDFTKDELIKAVEAYNHRDRKYGGIKPE